MPARSVQVSEPAAPAAAVERPGLDAVGDAVQELDDERDGEANNEEDDEAVEEETCDEVDDAQADEALEELLPVDPLRVGAVHHLRSSTTHVARPIVLLHTPGIHRLLTPVGDISQNQRLPNLRKIHKEGERC